MSITIPELKERLKNLRAGHMQLQANLQATDGAIEFVQRLIAELEAKASPAQPGPSPQPQAPS